VTKDNLLRIAILPSGTNKILEKYEQAKFKISFDEKTGFVTAHIGQQEVMIPANRDTTLKEIIEKLEAHEKNPLLC
jgi:hypothetical protein